MWAVLSWHDAKQNVDMLGTDPFMQFFTRQKVTMTRWFSYGEGDIWQR
jgi:hypothetical protein